MEQLGGRVAVVTGAASGIGRALALRFAAERMRVVLADVEEAPLGEALRAVHAAGGEAIAVPTDVSDAAAVRALARRSVDAFGGVHVLCNNAGVFLAGRSWDAPLEDFRWVMDVNWWGVLHGIQAFVPILRSQGEPGHVVNTASMAALTTMPLASAYHVSKHAVLALSECLYKELRAEGSPIGVSVLCPELVNTGIARAERNRPAASRAANAGEARDPLAALVEKTLLDGAARGLDPAVMAERVVRAIREERFWILAEDEWRDLCGARLDEIRDGRNPELRAPELEP